MRLLSHRALVCALALLAVACGGPPEWAVLDGELSEVLLSVSGASIDDVLAVGGPLGSDGEALVLHREAGGWRRAPAPFSETFWWVWAASPDEAFIVGEGGIIARWDGSRVSRMDSPVTDTLFGVWGSAPDDVWAVGGDPFGDAQTDIILHFDGSAWTEVPDPAPAGVALFKVWGAASDDVWVVGQHGASIHYDGASWTHAETGTSATLFTVNGNASGDVYAVGGPPAVVLRYAGGAWSEVTDTPGFASLLNGVAVGEAGEVLVVGARGTKWFLGTDGVWADEFAQDPASDLHGAWLVGGEALAVGGNFNAPVGTARVGMLAYRGTSPPPGALLS